MNYGKADIGIIGAMSKEIEALRKTLEDSSRVTLGGIDFHLGSIYGKRVVIAGCGVGKVFAAMCAQAMIIAFSPDLIVNTGVGGAIGGGISIGDIVVGERLVQHDMDTSALGDPKGLISGINKIYFEGDKRGISLLLSAAEELGIRAVGGTIASGDRFIADKESKDSIRDSFGASICEMEGAAIAQAAYVNGVPFLVIRAASDSADEGSSMDYMEFMPIAADRSARLTLALIKEY